MQLEGPPGSTPIAGPVPEIFKLRLVARKIGKEVVADQELVQLPTTSERALAIPTKLQGSSVVASGSSDTAVWNDRVAVWKVAAAGHRAIEVGHAGRAASLSADGAASEALSGTPFGGLWDLQSPLSEAEQREPSIRPTNLEIRVTILCKSGKS
jgi:hypothetical protein